MTPFLKLLTAFLTIAFTDVVIICIATIAAFAMANAMIKHKPQVQSDGCWPQIRQAVEVEP